MVTDSLGVVAVVLVVALARRALRAVLRPQLGATKVVGPVSAACGTVELRPSRRLVDRWAGVRGRAYHYRVYVDRRRCGKVTLFLDRGTDTAHVVFGGRFPQDDVDLVRTVVTAATDRLAEAEPWVRRVSTSVPATGHPLRAALVSLDFGYEGTTPGYTGDTYGTRRELWALVAPEPFPTVPFSTVSPL